MNDKTPSLFPLQKTEAIISGVVVSIVLLVGLISLAPSLLLFGEPTCDGIYFLVAPIVAFISFLFTIFWASIGLIRFVGKRAFIMTGDRISRSTHLTFLLPVLTILAIFAGRVGFIVLSIFAIFLFVTPYLTNRSSFKTNSLLEIGNIILSLIAFGLSIVLLFSTAMMCYISRF